MLSEVQPLQRFNSFYVVRLATTATLVALGAILTEPAPNMIPIEEFSGSKSWSFEQPALGTGVIALQLPPADATPQDAVVYLSPLDNLIAPEMIPANVGSLKPVQVGQIVWPQIDARTAISERLNALESIHVSLTSQFADARKFASKLPSKLTTIPQVWTDGETEVVLEWAAGDKHAIVSFEGDGEFGYAVRQGERFIPGSSSNKLDAAILDDLVGYLAKP